MKKIISFSVWGKDPKYAYSALTNLELSKTIYPGWTCRFYIDETVPENVVQELEKESEIILMPKSDGHLGAFWRFYVLDDLEVDRFIVRDTDSRLNIREADAVQEWEESNKAFHVMRDNEWHNVIPIPAGMWGATSEFKPNFKNLYDNWIKLNSHRAYNNPRSKYFFLDQSFLWECIWPLVVNKHIAHESVRSKWPGYKKDFRIKNPDSSFVGQPYDK